MKQTTLLSTAIVATLISSSAFAEPSLFDYKEATSSYEDAYLTGNFLVGKGNPTKDKKSGKVSQAQSYYNLDLSIDYEKVFSSASRNTKLDFNGKGSRERGANKGDASTSNYQLLGSATVDNYFRPNSNAAFWYGKGEIGAKKGADKIFTKATVGVGYGRVVNVTPMARAIRVVQALRKNGSLGSDISNSAYQSIANIIAKEAMYRSKYGAKDYKQYWFADIEKALKNGGSLGAKGTIKAYDVLNNERISTRKHGWLVRAGIGEVLSDYDGKKNKPAIEVGAEYHRPLSNQTQFSNEAIYTRTKKNNANSNTFNNNMTLTHELTDVIDWENTWALNYSKSDHAKSTTTNTLTSAFNYELTNQLDFNITASLSKVDDKISGNLNDNMDKKLTMGIKYRLK